MGLFFFVLLVFPKVFTKLKKPSRKSNIPKKTTEHKKKTFGKTKTTKLFKVSDPPLDMFSFLFVGFPEGFYKTKKNFEKIKNTKENHRKTKNKYGKPQQTI